MGLLIDALLHLSRVSRTELRMDAVDLSALARSIAREFEEGDPRRKVEFAIAEGVTARGDATLLRAVLENLLGNAWKFTARREDARISGAFSPTWPIGAASPANGSPPPRTTAISTWPSNSRKSAAQNRERSAARRGISSTQSRCLRSVSADWPSNGYWPATVMKSLLWICSARVIISSRPPAASEWLRRRSMN
jgi:hypothetical protein